MTQTFTNLEEKGARINKVSKDPPTPFTPSSIKKMLQKKLLLPASLVALHYSHFKWHQWKCSQYHPDLLAPNACVAFHEAGHAVYGHYVAKDVIKSLSCNRPFACVKGRKRDNPRIHVTSRLNFARTLAGPLMEYHFLHQTYPTSVMSSDWIPVRYGDDYWIIQQGLNDSANTINKEWVSFVESVLQVMTSLELETRRIAVALLTHTQLGKMDFLLLASRTYMEYLTNLVWYYGGQRLYDWLEFHGVRFGCIAV